MLKHIAAKEQWKLQYVFGSWPECLDRLESGEIDLMAAIAYSKARAKAYQYTHGTVVTNWGQVYTAEGSEIRSILDLDGKKVAVKMEDIHFLGIRELTSKFNIRCRFIEADEYDVVFELIQYKRVHVGVVNRLFGIQSKARYPVQETSIMFNPIEVRFAAPKRTSADILSAIDTHLRKMHSGEDPIYARTLNYWLVANSQWVLPNTLKYTFIGVGLVSVLFALMSVTLKKKVKKRTLELSSMNSKMQKEIKTRRAVEEELRKYAEIVASSTDHMAMIDLSYSYQAINKSALNAVNKTQEEAIGKTLWHVLGDVFPEKTHKKRLDRAFSGQVVNYRTWIRFPVLGNRCMVDLVILDMLMPPGMDGLDTYEEIIKIRPGQKAIIASGFAETDRVKKALDLGVGQFIKKPYTLMDIGLAIANVLIN